MAEGMRTDAQTETLDGTAGLVDPLPTGRDRDEHGHGERIARQGEHLNAVRSLSITVPAAAAIAPTRIAALARFAEKAKVTAVARLPALRRAATLVAFVHSLEASAQDDALEVLDRLLRDIFPDEGPSPRVRGSRVAC